MTFKRVGHTESTSYQIGNTRALLRQRNKMVGELQKKKKVTVNLGQRKIVLGTLFGDDGALSSCELAESMLSIGDKGILSSCKRKIADGYEYTDGCH
ncbi:unnamed protein product [Peronospora destructor]|uniref:Uncharacterized protein n=1 Tax=Peronospora destructor TaxID=86335 RepID=A0AAV0T6F6_9STRA|nr:unnamed protein product [Peronospora destructor]